VTDQEILRTLLVERSVSRGDFVLSSGQRSTYYIDARKTTMSAAGLGIIGRLGLAAIRTMGWAPDSIGGLTMGADPVAYAIARASLDSPPAIDAFSVRKAAKEHGTRKLVEGCFVPGASTVVIEDVITSGASARQAIEAVRSAGGKVLGVLAVVDREQGGCEAIERVGVKIAALVTTTDLGL
jgi:orotate phosphoribosyltransferase